MAVWAACCRRRKVCWWATVGGQVAAPGHGPAHQLDVDEDAVWQVDVAEGTAVCAVCESLSYSAIIAGWSANGRYKPDSGYPGAANSRSSGDRGRDLGRTRPPATAVGFGGAGRLSCCTMSPDGREVQSGDHTLTRPACPQYGGAITTIRPYPNCQAHPGKRIGEL